MLAVPDSCFFFLCSDPVESNEETSETEESGDGSGYPFPFADLSRKERNVDPEEWQVQQIYNEEDGSGRWDELDYSNYIAPEGVKPKLSAEDLRDENMIEWAEISQSNVT